MKSLHKEKGSFRDRRAPSISGARMGESGTIDGSSSLRNSLGEIKTSRSTNGVHKAIGRKINPRERSSFIILVLIVIFVFFVLLIQSPKAILKERRSNNNHFALQSEDRKEPHQIPESCSYPTNLEIQWNQISAAIFENHTKAANLRRIGLLNFNATEVKEWNRIFTNSTRITSTIHLPRASSNITWETLFPEWIDEEHQYGVPTCPVLPHPAVHVGSDFDLVAVKLPCHRDHKSGRGWARDVGRLHLQLAAATAATSTSGQRRNVVHVLVLSQCFPLPNLFRLKEVVFKEGNTWLYEIDVEALRKKLLLPIGSCTLAVPSKPTGNVVVHGYRSGHRPWKRSNSREAYVTILHSAPKYICGAIAAARSIRMTGSTRDLVVLVDRTIDSRDRSALASSGWIVREIDRIRNPKLKRHAYNEYNYSKLRLWQLTSYDTLVFLDADVLVLRNIDFLFAYPEITATGNDRWLFNSGVMVVEPSNATFGFLMDHIHEIDSYNGGDQGFLNEVFTWWHRMGRGLNFLKYFGDGRRQQKETSLGEAHVVHYLGMKPWWCYRDYDCNWNMGPSLRNFASDVANDAWWKIYDTMPKSMRGFCSLRTKQKAALEWHRRDAEKANYTDGHWKLKVRDARKKECLEKYCDWETMLRHWGDNKKKGGAKKTNISAT